MAIFTIKIVQQKLIREIIELCMVSVTLMVVSLYTRDTLENLWGNFEKKICISLKKVIFFCCQNGKMVVFFSQNFPMIFRTAGRHRSTDC